VTETATAGVGGGEAEPGNAWAAAVVVVVVVALMVAFMVSSWLALSCRPTGGTQPRRSRSRRIDMPPVLFFRSMMSKVVGRLRRPG
jgi:hypothetical protein